MHHSPRTPVELGGHEGHCFSWMLFPVLFLSDSKIMEGSSGLFTSKQYRSSYSFFGQKQDYTTYTEYYILVQKRCMTEDARRKILNHDALYRVESAEEFDSK